MKNLKTAFAGIVVLTLLVGVAMTPIHSTKKMGPPRPFLPSFDSLNLGADYRIQLVRVYAEAKSMTDQGATYFNP